MRQPCRRWRAIRQSALCSANRSRWMRLAGSPCGARGRRWRWCCRSGCCSLRPGSPGARRTAGRWDVLLAGRLPVTAVVAWHVAVLVAASLTAGTAAFAGLVAAGAAVSGAAVHSAALGLCGVFFAAAGMMSAQVFATRAAASGAAVALLGIGMLLRMVGDGVAPLGGCAGCRLSV